MAHGQVAKILTNPLSGKVIAAVMGELPSYTMIFWNASGNGTNEYGGSIYEELLWLSLSLNFSFDMKPLRGSAFGGLTINGSYDGMIGELHQKTSDVVVSAFDSFYYPVYDVSAYTITDEYGMAIRYPTPQSSIYGHITIFSPGVWLGLLLSMIVLIVFIKLLDIFNRKYFADNQGSSSAVLSNLTNISLYIFATLTNHGGYYKSSNYRALGVMAATWCFATFVFVNAYSSCLTQYMSLLFQRPDINTIQDLAENTKYKLVIVSQSGAENRLFNPESTGFVKQVGDKLIKCPENVCRTSDYGVAIKKVLDAEENFVTFTLVTMAKNEMYKTFSNGTCRLTLAQYKMPSTHYYMACPRKSPYTFPLFIASLRYHAFGFNHYWESKMMPGALQCQLKYNSWGECVSLVDQVRLKLEQFYIAFAVLFGGYVLALLQFLWERFTRY